MMLDRLPQALENSARPRGRACFPGAPWFMDRTVLPLRQGPLDPGFSADLLQEKYSASVNFSVIMLQSAFRMRLRTF
jgi:hypothetical protein